TGGLPIDANLLFKRFTWGFTFLPINGFPYLTPEDPEDPTAGDIVWDDYPLRVRVTYFAKYRDGIEQTLYLNRWGFWQPVEPVTGWLRLTAVDYAGDDLTLTFAGFPLTGDALTAIFILTPTGTRTDYNYIVEPEQEGSLSATLAAWAATIPGASSTSTTITIPEPEPGIYLTGGRVNSGKDNLLPGNWLDIDVEGMKIGDVASVVFQGKGGNNEILFPDPGALPNIDPEAGVLNIEFALLAGQRYVLDDVWMQVEDNNDVYRASTASRGNSQSIT